MRPAILRRVAVASQRRLKSTAASQRSAASLLADFDALQAKQPAKARKGKSKAPQPGSELTEAAKPTESAPPVAKSARPEIKYKNSMVTKSMERLAFFAGDEVDFAGGDVEAAEDVPGIEVGRVVELRR